ncbi:MAG: helix-turn-helix domain-containing protein [Azonexus sp.]|nr:helix-turn-helix domain-containing protein [Azonexus sp.]
MQDLTLIAGKAARVTAVEVSAAEARNRVGMSQSEFAKLLGVSVRTLQDWEQGRREPSGVARTLLRIASQNPEAVKAIALHRTHLASIAEAEDAGN